MIVITKEQFINYMKEYKRLRDLSDNLDEALRKFSPDFGGFHNGKAFNMIIELLKDLMGDRQTFYNEDGTMACNNWSEIEYFLYEVNYDEDFVVKSEDHELPYGNLGELYDYLVKIQK